VFTNIKSGEDVVAELTNRQREIIDASINLIDENGIQNLTIKNLARAMKISEPAIYRHFDSKLDILVAILDDFNSTTEKSLNPAKLKSKSALEKIEYIFTSHMDIFTEKPSLASVVFSEEIFQNDKNLADTVYEIMKMRFRIITGIVNQGQSAGEIRQGIPPEQIALMLTGSLRLIVTNWRLSRHAFSLRKEGKEFWVSMKKLITETG
jgi:AcrR family transcriptional regulator